MCLNLEPLATTYGLRARESEPPRRPQLVGGALLPDALAEAYGGHAPDVSELCLPQPDTVPLSQLGCPELVLGFKAFLFNH